MLNSKFEQIRVLASCTQLLRNSDVRQFRIEMLSNCSDDGFGGPAGFSLSIGSTPRINESNITRKKRTKRKAAFSMKIP